MDEIVYVAQVRDCQTGEIKNTQEIYSKVISKPTDFDQFGLRHKEQIELIRTAQDFYLAEQVDLHLDDSTCPNCHQKAPRKGKFTSDFHDVFTDHKITLSRFMCTCGWQSAFTINKLYGKAMHPELAKLQASIGAKMSFGQSTIHLNTLCANERKVNNRGTVQQTVNRVGQALEPYKKSERWSESTEETDTLIVCTDGGHVQDYTKDKHSFEEMISTCYNLSKRTVDDNGKATISERISVASAKYDKQATIKKLTTNACKRLGMTSNTYVVGLTDGAKNCWSIITALEKECAQLERILDWFHIGKKYKERESKIPVELRELYAKSKWHLWHGKPKTALLRLEQLYDQLELVESKQKLKQLMTYIKNNQTMIVNYRRRQKAKLPYSSQLAETSVNSVINERQKNKKMQWSRHGAHNILQIRTSLFSKTWEQDWRAIQSTLYHQAA